MLRLSLESRARVEDGTAQKKKQKKKGGFPRKRVEEVRERQVDYKSERL